MADAGCSSSDDAARGTKRAASSASDTLSALRSQIVGKMAGLSEKSVEELESAVEESPEATVLELGLSSAMGVALKGWVFKTLEAELTTFQLLKQPLKDVIEAIGAGILLQCCASLPLSLLLLLLLCARLSSQIWRNAKTWEPSCRSCRSRPLLIRHRLPR